MSQTTMRTLLFSVRTSRRSRTVLLRTLRVYTTAAAALVSAAQSRWNLILRDSLYKDRLSALSLEKVLRARYAHRLDPVRYPLHSSVREALFADIAAALASYHALSTAYETDKARILTKAQSKGLCIDPPEAKVKKALDELGDPPSWPTIPRVRPDYRTYNALLDDLKDQITEDGPSRLRLSQALASGTRPLFYPRADGAARNRNFGLLRTTGKAVVTSEGAPKSKHRHKRLQYRALLYLLPAGDERARPLAVPPKEDGWDPLIPLQPVPEGESRERVEQLRRTGLERTQRPSPALLLPVECSKWHEETVEEAALHPEMVRAARLIHRPARIMAGGRRVPERFFLAVTFEHQVPQPITVQTYLGVAMDEDARVGWCIRHITTGQTLASGVAEDLWGLQVAWRERRRAAMRKGKLPPRQHHRQREQVRHAVHRVANQILDLATEHNAQIALNDVRYLRTRKPFVPRPRPTEAPPPTHAAPTRTHRRRLRPRDPVWAEARAELAYKRACLVIGDLERIVNYKGRRRGLPLPLSIGGISPRDCAQCGQRGEEALFCSHCGHRLGSENTAQVTAARIPDVLDRLHKARERRQKERLEREQNGDLDP